MSSPPSSPPAEAICPECGTPLALIEPGEATCPHGHGRALAVDAARRRTPEYAHAMLGWLVDRAPLAHRACPVCRGPMARAQLPLPPRKIFGWTRLPMVHADACPECRVVWLDAAALGALS